MAGALGALGSWWRTASRPATARSSRPHGRDTKRDTPEVTDFDLDRRIGGGPLARSSPIPHGATAAAVAIALRGARSRNCAPQTSPSRLPPDIRHIEAYERWYGKHKAPELLEGAVYGLTEFNREQLATQSSSPRRAATRPQPCWPWPLVAELGRRRRDRREARRLWSREARGRRCTALHRDGREQRPYKIAGAPSRPEIASWRSWVTRRVTFVPHLLPIDQGELVSCYAQDDRADRQDEVHALYEKPTPTSPSSASATAPRLLGMSSEPTCAIFDVSQDRSRILVFAAIDNLWKGAASQAVQNLNLALGLPEREGRRDSHPHHRSSERFMDRVAP